MAEFGYTYRSFSTYNTTSVRSETSGPVAKPFSPFVPPIVNGNSEGHVPKKTIVPMSRKPYGDEAYDHHTRGGDDQWRNHPQTSPVRGSPHKVDDFPTRPSRSIPVTSPTDWRHSSPPKPYRGANGYGDDYGRNKPIGGKYDDGTNYGYGHKEGSKPIGGTIKNNDKYDGYNGTNNLSKPIKNHQYDGYNGTTYPSHGNYVNKPNHDGTNGYGDYKPVRGTNWNENHDGGDYGNKEGHKPRGNPIKNDYHDGYNGSHNKGNGGYKDYNNKGGHNPPSSPIRNGYNNNNGYGGYGISNGNDREKGKPFGVAGPTRNDDKDYDDYGSWPRPVVNGGGPKISSAWTVAPRKGTQLSEPTHDIDKAMELLMIEAAKRNGHGSNGGHKSYDHYDNNQRGYDRPSPGQLVGNKTALPTSKFDNLVNETASPQSRSSVSNKDDKRTSQTHFLTILADIGQGADYGIINHREAKKRFNGETV